MTRKRRLAHVRRSMEASKPPRAVPFGAIREARASVALDHDPDYGTHSVDDGCPGGHRGCTDAQPCRHPELRWVHSQACRGTT